MIVTRNVLGMAKGRHRYIFYYDDDPESLRVLGEVCDKFANDEETNMTHSDAALLKQKARESQARNTSFSLGDFE